MHQISTVENPAARIDTDPIVSVEPLPAEEAAKYTYYDDWEQLSDPPDAGEVDDRRSDSSDFEETYLKRKKKKNKVFYKNTVLWADNDMSISKINVVMWTC